RRRLPPDDLDVSMAPGKHDPASPKLPRHLARRAKLAEASKNQVDRLLYLEIGILDHATLLEPHQACRQIDLELSSPRLVESACHQAASKRMELELAQHPLHPQKQPVVGGSRIVDPFAIRDQALAVATGIEKGVPVRAVSAESGALVAQK